MSLTTLVKPRFNGVYILLAFSTDKLNDMTNKERNLIKKKILKCLTEDFKNNQAIFDKKEGWQVFNGTDLDMVMDKVVKGLEMAKHELNADS